MASSSTDHTIPFTYVVAVRDVRYHSVAALSFLVWQAFLTFDDEVRYIWAMRNKSPFKWTYFYLRYGVIAAHVMHNCLMERLADGSNPPMLCDMWRAYVIAFTQSLGTLLELLLASRVFALYNRSRKIAVLLSVLILMEVAKAIRMLWSRGTIESRGACLLIQLANYGRDQTILGFIIHCILICLIVIKYIIAVKAGWGRTPLVSLVVRDGSTVYATIFFVVISVFLILGLGTERGVGIFFWATALISVVGCHSIVSMERLARKEVPIESSEPVFTTEFGLGPDETIMP